MSPQPAVPILRVILDAGHGYSNKTPRVFDDGAVSCYGVEAQLVAAVADSVIAAVDADDSLSVTAIHTPLCDEDCVEKHPTRSHLAFKVEWVNHHAAPFDLLLALHMNAADDARVSGVEVYYSKLTPHRKDEAEIIGKAVASYLDLPFRGAFRSDQSQHSKLAIIDETKPEAYLLELGFVTNGQDVAKVKQCGAGAVLAAIRARRDKK